MAIPDRGIDLSERPESVEQHPPSSSDRRRLIADDSQPLQTRCEALVEWLSNEEQAAAQVLVEQLERDDLAGEWRNQLILVAERTQFDEPRLRRRLKDRLYELALSLRRSTEPHVRRIVESCIRCFTSLIELKEPSEAAALHALLEPPNPVETRLVTLQCLVHLFEHGPPSNGDELQALRDRVHELAEKFLDRDWLVPGEKAAIGQNATQALAVLGDDRLGRCVEKVRALNLPWLTRQVARKLQPTTGAERSSSEDDPREES